MLGQTSSRFKTLRDQMEMYIQMGQVKGLNETSFGNNPEEKLAKSGWGWRTEEIEENSIVEGIALAILQHLTGKYDLTISFQDINGSSASGWDELTKPLGDQMLPFLQEISRVNLKFSENNQSLADCCKAVTEVFKKYWPLFDTSQNEIIIIILRHGNLFDDFENNFQKLQDQNPIFLFNDEKQEKIFLIARYENIYPNVEELVYRHWSDFKYHFDFIFRSWLNTNNFNILQRIQISQSILEEFKAGLRVESLIQAFLNNEIVKSSEDLWGLKFISNREKDLPEHQLNELLCEMKCHIIEEYKTACQQYDLEQREAHLLEDQKLEEAKMNMLEEKTKLQNLIQKFTEQEQKEIEKETELGKILKKQQDSLNWLNFQSELYKIIPRIEPQILQIQLKDKSLNLAKTISEIYSLKKTPISVQQRLNQGSEQDRNELYNIFSQTTKTSYEYDEDSKVVEVHGVHFKLSDVWDQIQENINSYESIHFVASGILRLDIDIPQHLAHGKNFVFIAKQIEIAQDISINVSGNDADRFTQMKPPTSQVPGMGGEKGENGRAGESGGHVHIESLEEIVGVEKILWIKCNGGNGADGQDGGDGASGRKGEAGNDGQVSDSPPSVWHAKVDFKHGQPGKAGTTGGDAGQGGLGGEGGHEGTITIISASSVCKFPDDDEHSIHEDKFQYAKGLEGSDGSPGKPGEGGKGGKHGEDEAWATLSAWWFDKWEPYKGYLKEMKYETFWKTGVIIEKNQFRPDGLTGQKGRNAHTAHNSNDRNRSKSKKAISKTKINAFRAKLNNQSNKAIEENTSLIKSHMCEIMQKQKQQEESQFTTYRNQILKSQKSLQEIDEKSLRIENVQTLEKQRASQIYQISTEHNELCEKYVAKIQSDYDHQQQRISQQSVTITKPRNVKMEGSKFQNKEEKVKDPIVSQMVCSSINTSLAQKCIQMVNNEPDPRLKTALEHCLQQFLTADFEIEIPFKILKTLLKNRPSKIGPHFLAEFVGKVYPKHCFSCVNEVTTLRKLLEGLFPSVPVANLTVAKMIYQLHTAQRLTEKEIILLETTAYDHSDDGGLGTVLRDILQHHLVNFYAQKCTESKETSPFQNLNSIFKNAKTKARKAASYLPFQSQQQNVEEVEEAVDTLDVYENIIAQLIPILREFCNITKSNNYRPEKPITISSCLDGMLEEFTKGSEKITNLEKILENILRLQANHTVDSIISSLSFENIKSYPIFQFIVERSNLTCEQLDKLVKELDKNYSDTLSHSQFLDSLINLYNRIFREEALQKMTNAISNSLKDPNYSEAKDHFVQLIESPEGLLTFQERLHEYHLVCSIGIPAELENHVETVRNKLSTKEWNWDCVIPNYKKEEFTFKLLGEELVQKLIQDSDLQNLIRILMKIQFDLKFCKPPATELHSISVFITRSFQCVKSTSKMTKKLFLLEESLQKCLQKCWQERLDEMLYNLKNKYNPGSSTENILSSVEKTIEKVGLSIVDPDHESSYFQMKINIFELVAIQTGKCAVLRIIQKEVDLGQEQTAKERLARIEGIIDKHIAEALLDFKSCSCSLSLSLSPYFKILKYHIANKNKKEPQMEHFIPIFLLKLLQSSRQIINSKLQEENLTNQDEDLLSKIKQLPKKCKPYLYIFKILEGLHTGIKSLKTKGSFSKISEERDKFLENINSTIQSLKPKWEYNLDEIRALDPEMSLEYNYFSKLKDEFDRLDLLNSNQVLQTEERCLVQTLLDYYEVSCEDDTKMDGLEMARNHSDFETAYNFLIGEILLSERESKASEADQRFCRVLNRTCPKFAERCLEKFKMHPKPIPLEYLEDISNTLFSEWTNKPKADVKLLEELQLGINLVSKLKNGQRLAADILRQIINVFQNEESLSNNNEIWESIFSIVLIFNNESSLMPLAAIYFSPVLTKKQRALILRIHYGNPNAEVSIPQNSSEEDDGDPSQPILDELLPSPNFAETLINEQEAKFWKFTKIHDPNAKLPLEQMKEDHPSAWTRLFQGQYLTSILSQIDHIETTESRNRLSDGLESWRAEASSDPKWFTLMSTLIASVKRIPISLDDLSLVFESATLIPLLTMEQIIGTWFPNNWPKQTLLAKIQFLLSENYPQEVNLIGEIIASINNLNLSAKDKYPALKLNLLELLSNTVARKCSGTSLKDIQRLIVSLSKSRLSPELLTSLSAAKLNGWEEVCRRFAYKELKLTEPVIKLALKVEKKYQHYTEEFVIFLIGRYGPTATSQDAQGELDVDTSTSNIIQKFLTMVLHGECILNKDILTMLRETKATTSPSELQIQLKKEMKSLPDLQGSNLIDNFMELEMNSQSDEKPEENRLKEDLQEIRDYLRPQSSKRSIILPPGVLLQTPISEWTTTDIKMWSLEIRKISSESDSSDFYLQYKVEMLAVISRAIYLSTDAPSKGKSPYWPRDTQLTSVLLFIQGVISKTGRFAEIATSEGKTDISAILTLMLALGGHTVDVLTSSSILAKTASENMSTLFEILDISMGNNCDDACRKSPGWEGTLTKRYRNLVLYGDISSFESDTLYHEHFGKEHTQGRVAEFIIVDEVDSLLLDKGTHVLYISHVIPELKYLRPILIQIFKSVKMNPDGLKVLTEIQSKFQEGKLNIPKFLHTFVENRIPIWISNAYEALSMEQNNPYVLSKENSRQGQKVTIVDLDTGEEQESMQYSMALQQFLQMKHKEKISSESLKAVFISNLGYLQRFKGKIFGITGTLGTKTARELLREHFNLQYFKMPRFRFKNCIREDGIVTFTSEDHLEKIRQSVHSRFESQPTLIICPHVKSALAIYNFLKSKANPNQRIWTYLSSSDDDKFFKEFSDHPLKAGDIIISTNLAGRGTDLEVSPDCEAGLHVLLSYLPGNSRVEKQAFGRTARAGRRGSTQYIICDEENPPITSPTIEFYQEEMKFLENSRLTLFEKKEIPQIKLEEKLFTQFGKNLKELRKHFSRDPESLLKVKVTLVTNQWAFWLDSIQEEIQMIDVDPSREESLTCKFNAFWEKIQSSAKTGELCTSPAEFVKLARVYEDLGDFNQAINLLQKSIDFEPEFNYIAHCNLGICLLKNNSGKTPYELRHLARTHLKMAANKIRQQLNSLEDMKVDLLFIDKLNCTTQDESKDSSSENTYLEQIQHESDLLQRHLCALADIVGEEVPLTYFNSLPQICQDSKISEAVHKVIQKTSLLKCPRISKKVTVQEGSDGILKLTRDNVEVPLSPHWDSSTSQRILSILRLKIFPNNLQIAPEDFKNSVQTKESVWRKMLECKFIHNSQTYETWRIHFDEDLYKSIEEIPAVYKIVVGRCLFKNNWKEYNPTIFKDLHFTPEFSISSLEALLKQHEILARNEHFNGDISPECKKQLKIGANFILEGLPSTLEPWRNTLSEWIVTKDDVGNRSISSQLDTKALNLPDQRCINYEIEDIFNDLCRIGVIKNFKLNWNLESNHKKEKAQRTKIKELFNSPESKLHQDLHKIFKEYHPNPTEDFSKYLKSIRKRLVGSAGKIKTLESISVDNSHSIISDFKSDPSYYTELGEIITEDFDRIPTLKKNIPWFQSGAFYLMCLATLQIGLGVAIAILSGGTLANLSAMLISEGGSDMMYAIQSGFSGNFSWGTYAVYKCFSVGASILTGGLSGITGASFLTSIGKEVAKAVIKKVLWNVGRYVVQGLVYTGLNMGIEALLDQVRTFVSQRCAELFKMFVSFDSTFSAAKTKLDNILSRLYDCTYARGQAESVMFDSLNVMMSREDEKSTYYHSFKSAASRVAHFATEQMSAAASKVLGSNFWKNLKRMWNYFKKAISSKSIDVGKFIKEFAVSHVEKLCKFFEQKIKDLTARGEHHLGPEKSDEKDFVKEKTKYMNTLSQRILDDGLLHLQEEFAEPALKTMSNRVVNAGFKRMFQNKQATFSKNNGLGNSKTGGSWRNILQERKTPNEHYAVEMDTSRGRHFEPQSRNNMWTAIDYRAIVWNVQQSVGTVREVFGSFVLLYPAKGQKVSAVFILDENSQELAKKAEAMGLPVVRRVQLP